MPQKNPIVNIQNGVPRTNSAKDVRHCFTWMGTGPSKRRVTICILAGIVMLSILSIAYRTTKPTQEFMVVYMNDSRPGLKPLTYIKSHFSTLLQTPTVSTTSGTPTSTTSATPTSTSMTTSTRPTRNTPRLTSVPTTIPVTATRRPDDVSRYVSFSGGFADGRGLGNQIFCFAAVLYVAELTGREPAIEKFKYVIKLDEVFDLNVERFDSLCPCYRTEESKSLAFDEETDRKVLNNPETFNKSILVGGFRQSWRYTLAIERRLRRHLVFKTEIQKFAEEFLRKHIPAGWNRVGFVRVAIHIRRGDIVTERHLKFGYTVPKKSYFEKAMKYFTDRFRKVQFIAVSEDSKWTSEHINLGNQTSVQLTHAFGHSFGQDMALISMCDHVIMSSGTFGWWGSWLAKGTTIYYGDWPRNGSDLEKQFKRNDFFPPSWIPMTD